MSEGMSLKRKAAWLLFLGVSLLAAVYLVYKTASPFIWPLPFEGPYFGRVQDDDTGRPIPGAEVEARWLLHDNPLPDGSGHYSVIITEKTDGQGRYQLDKPFRRRGFFRNDFFLSVRAPGYIEQVVIRDPSQTPLPQSTLDYTLVRTSTRPSMPGELDFSLKPAGPVLVAALGSGDEGWLRLEAAARLGNLAPDRPDLVLPALEKALTDEDASVRERAAASIGAYGSLAERSIPLLIERMRDPAEWVRAKAALALGRIGSGAAPAVPALIEALLEDPERMVRENAAQALGDIGPAAEEAVPALRRAVKDSEGWVGREAKKALERIIGTD